MEKIDKSEVQGKLLPNSVIPLDCLFQHILNLKEVGLYGGTLVAPFPFQAR